ncbi:DUF4297 family anti-phage-associated protein [Acinetobacter sp. MD2]|uniref:DUF4297 family anti-phage-associated protein n=1 Tax=Acinetobacter sp. MD2 TaxID=2600066 RepID=UPI002D1E9774|nr:DUF4297 family anti-phage-associated protein [Acinetobacter sp. MD2]MEB3768153.1 hypothetical protein [Acinetobacter sp. MD2]
MTKSRDAIDTIRGYYYQFDLTISQILSQTNEKNSIEIEGIEDIDITSLDGKESIQCKYYEGSAYKHSLIKDAIVFFAEHYSKVKNNPEKKIKYTLYGYYKSGHNSLDGKLDVEFYKENFFTYKKYKKEMIDGKEKTVLDKLVLKHEEFSLSDKDILDFISLVKININGKEFAELEDLVITQLENQFNCSKIMADYYYNNSLAIIKSLAVNKNINKRKITKKDFVHKISESEKKIFNAWYFKKRGSKNYNNNIKNQIFKNNRNSDYFRIFMIENNMFGKMDLVDFLIELSRKWSNLDGKRIIEKFCPSVYLHNYCDKDLVEVKSLLMGYGVLIEDGHYYNNSKFNSKLFVRIPTHNTCNYRVNLKIINTLNDLESILKEDTKYKIIYQFYAKEPFFSSSNVMHHDIYFDKLNSIKEMIL